jgi:hypothetical protein
MSTIAPTTPAVSASFDIDARISIPIMAAAAGIADIWRQRTSGRGQDGLERDDQFRHGVRPSM